MTHFCRAQLLQFIIFLLFTAPNSKLFAGYGDCIDTLPSALEREVHVMTNAVRMDPVGFRNMYIPGTSILLPENYPAVAPIYYNHDLSRAARYHTVEMAQNCGLQHNSCDGTPIFTRIRSFYKASRKVGENIATGRTTGLQTVVQWLRDDINPGSGSKPAPDKSGHDGHRQNIMSAEFNEIGIGYVYNSSKRFRHFWTQNFGGRKVTQYKIPAGCHFIIPKSSDISYCANFYDGSGTPPKSAHVVIDEKTYPLTLHLGSKAHGTYIYTTTIDKMIHCYYFLFIDGNGTQIRFPESARLTTGTTLCCEEATGLKNTQGCPVVHPLLQSVAYPKHRDVQEFDVDVRLSNNFLKIVLYHKNRGKFNLKILDISGRKIYTESIQSRQYLFIPLPETAKTYLIHITGQAVDVRRKIISYKF